MRTSAVVTFPPTVSLWWDSNPGLWGWIANPQTSREFQKCRRKHVSARSLTKRRLIRAVSFLKSESGNEGPGRRRRPLGIGGEHALPGATEPWAGAVMSPKHLSRHQNCHPMGLTAQEHRSQCRGTGFREKKRPYSVEARSTGREMGRLGLASARTFLYLGPSLPKVPESRPVTPTLWFRARDLGSEYHQQRAAFWSSVASSL